MRAAEENSRIYQGLAQNRIADKRFGISANNRNFDDQILLCEVS